MSDDLASWPRPRFESGGGNPFLLYFVFGAFDAESMAIDGRTYRTAGVPDGIEVFLLSGNGPDAQSVTTSYLGAMLDEDPRLAKAVRAAPQMLLYRGDVGDRDTLDYLRDTVGTLTGLLERGGVAVLDALGFRWFSPGDFREMFFTPGNAEPFAHVSILTSEEPAGGGDWIHTRGMRKFGRPDVSIHHVTPDRRDAMIELCNRLIEMQAFGAIIPEGQEVLMRGVPSGITLHHAGTLEDPDFNNVHLDVRRA